MNYILALNPKFIKQYGKRNPYFLAILRNFRKKEIAYTLNGENCVILKSQPYHNLIVKVIDNYVSVNLVSSFVYLKFPHFNDVNQFYYKLESHGWTDRVKLGSVLKKLEGYSLESALTLLSP